MLSPGPVGAVSWNPYPGSVTIPEGSGDPPKVALVGPGAPKLGTPWVVPPSRSDTRALIVAIGSLLVAGVVVALFLFWATRTGPPSEGPAGEREIPLGPAETRHGELAEEGPVYFADPFGGPGFWLALENDEIVALHVMVPGRSSCPVNWRAVQFEDCDGEAVESFDLDRYQVELPTDGDQEGNIVVDVATIQPAPNS